MLCERRLLWIAVAFRLFNCCLIQTYFVPDEQWQSLEVAHRMAFGSGFLTWEWRIGLRSYVYPLCFAALYWLLQLFHADYRTLVVFLPALLQSVFAAVGDFFLFKLAKLLHGEHVAVCTLLCWCSTWFGFFCMPRTLANSVETVLLVIGLYFYPWPSAQLYQPQRSVGGAENRDECLASTWRYLSIAVLSVFLRPTAAVFWLPLCLWHLSRATRKLSFIIGSCMPAITSVALVCICLDRICSGRWYFSVWNFVAFNVMQGGSAFFGSHPWHWYFTVGLPVVCFTHSIPICLGVYKARDRLLCWLCLWYTFVHSFIAHKEWRFLLPCLPLLCLYAGQWLSFVSHFRSRQDEPSEGFAANVQRICGLSKRARALLLFLCASNFPLAFYTGLLHQRGAMDVTAFIHSSAQRLKTERQTDASVWFLMPCHSTPFFSHVHSNISMRVLSCEPNFDARSTYVEEADVFHADPVAWLRHALSAVRKREDYPTHLVLFEKTWRKLESLLAVHDYALCSRLFYAHFAQSSRQSTYIVVACSKLRESNT